ncbi:MAG: hypothetical protein LBH00_00260 [Planctomycetaceae bacterium]|nr:hypothetical protein [Planctomycetaceae bacterium]
MAYYSPYRSVCTGGRYGSRLLVSSVLNTLLAVPAAVLVCRGGSQF